MNARIQLLLVSFAISGAGALLAGLVGHEIFGAPFGLVFAVFFFLTFVPIYRASITKFDGGDKNQSGELESPRSVTQVKKMTKPGRIRRIFLRGVLFGVIGLVTTLTVEILHLQTQEKSHTLTIAVHQLLFSPEGVLIIPTVLILGFSIAIAVETLSG